MRLTDYVIEGNSYSSDEWSEFWVKIRNGPLKGMHLINLGPDYYSSRECYFSWDRTWDRTIGKNGSVRYIITHVDQRNEQQRREARELKKNAHRRLHLI